MGLLTKENKGTISSTYKSIADAYASKLDVYCNYKLDYNYDGRDMLITGPDECAFIQFRISNHYKVQEEFNKVINVNTNVPLQLAADESTFTENRVIFKSDKNISILHFSEEQDILIEINNVDINTRSLYLDGDGIQLNNVNIITDTLILSNHTALGIEQGISGYIQTNFIRIYAKNSNEWEAIFQKCITPELMYAIVSQNVNTTHLSMLRSIDPIQNLGLNAQCANTLQVLNKSSNVLFTRNADDCNLYNRQCYCLANGWYLIHINS